MLDRSSIVKLVTRSRLANMAVLADNNDIFGAHHEAIPPASYSLKGWPLLFSPLMPVSMSIGAETLLFIADPPFPLAGEALLCYGELAT